MNEAVSIPLTLADPPRRDRQIVATAAISVLLHLLLLGWILLPRVQLPEPTEPKSVNVELVPPSELSSLEPPVSSEPPSSLPPPASSDAAASSAEPPSSAEPSSAEAPSSAAASSAAAPSSAVASAEPSSAISSAPSPQARPVVIPVGPSEASSDPASSVEDESASEAAQSSEASSDASGASAPDAESSLLTANTPDASGDLEQPSSELDGTPEAATDGPPPPAGALHSAKRFYLADMLQAPALAAARKALKTLPPEKRLAQTCNIEALGQIGNAGKGFEPDALVASAFAKPVIAGTTYSVSNGAFRSKQKWVAVAYDCTLSKKLDAVSAFTFRIGNDVTDAMEARFGAKRSGG